MINKCFNSELDSNLLEKFKMDPERAIDVLLVLNVPVPVFKDAFTKGRVTSIKKPDYNEIEKIKLAVNFALQELNVTPEGWLPNINSYVARLNREQTYSLISEPEIKEIIPNRIF